MTPTIEEAILSIGKAGIGKITYVEVTTAINVNVNGTSKPSYSARAWRHNGPTPPMASAYNLKELIELMHKAIAKYPSPETDRQRAIDELEAKLKELKGERSNPKTLEA